MRFFNLDEITARVDAIRWIRMRIRRAGDVLVEGSGVAVTVGIGHIRLFVTIEDAAVGIRDLTVSNADDDAIWPLETQIDVTVSAGCRAGETPGRSH